jgi:acetyl esterase/lipase
MDYLFEEDAALKAFVLVSLAICAGLAQDQPGNAQNLNAPAGNGQKAAKNQAPKKWPQKYTHAPDLADVPYGPHQRNKFDLWRAKSGKPTPLAIYYHPGGFSLGDKSSIPTAFLEACLEKGISVATVNYRYSFQAHYPAPFQDSARALQFLRLHAKEYNVDPKRVTAQGASAGGGISMWLGFKPDMADPKSDDPVQRQSTRLPVIAAVDGQCTYDPRLIAKLIDEDTGRLISRMALWQLFGFDKNEDPFKAEKFFPAFEDSSAINFIKAGAPPAFLYYHAPLEPLPVKIQADAVHNIRHGLAVKERMDKLGIECVVRDSSQYQGATRAEQLNRDMVTFFLKYL